MRTNIRIINYKTQKGGESIMRGTPLGNQNLESKYGRTKCIEMFRRDLWEDIKIQGPMYKELCRLYRIWKNRGKLTIKCCCKPLNCHGDVVKAALLWLDSQGALLDR